MDINSHKTSRCNQLQFNFTVSDDIKFLPLTNLTLFPNEAVSKNSNLFFKISTKIMNLASKIVPTSYNLNSFETLKVQLLNVADVSTSLHPLRKFEQPFTSP